MTNGCPFKLNKYFEYKNGLTLKLFDLIKRIFFAELTVQKLTETLVKAIKIIFHSCEYMPKFLNNWCKLTTYK